MPKTITLNFFEVEYYREGDESGYRKVPVTFATSPPTDNNDIDNVIVKGFWEWFSPNHYEEDRGAVLLPANGSEKSGKYFLAFCGQGGIYGSINGQWHEEGFGDYYLLKAKGTKQAKAYLRNLRIYPDFIQEVLAQPVVAPPPPPPNPDPPAPPPRPMAIASQGRLFLK